MQNPVGARFNPDTMRMEVTNFMEVVFNPVAQAKFVHTVVGRLCVRRGVRARRQRALHAARQASRPRQALDGRWRRASVLPRRCRWSCSATESGYVATEHQKMKIAAMEAMYETERRRQRSTLFAIPGRDGHPAFEVQFPWILGIITTRSFDRDLPGITELTEHAAAHHATASRPTRRSTPSAPTPMMRRRAPRSRRASTISVTRCC